VVGEDHCYGDRVSCASDAPTLAITPSSNTPGSDFQVATTRLIEPTWVYELPGTSSSTNVDIVPAYDGGVWARESSFETATLDRINAVGELVDTQPLNSYGSLLVDGETLDALVVGSGSYQRVNERGEISQYPLARIEPARSYMWQLAPGRDGGVRTALFRERDAYVADYDPLGTLVWKQSDLRPAQRVLAEDGSDLIKGMPVFRLVPLSDGALAVLLPKSGTLPGLFGGSTIDRGQGVTLLEADGNVRWDVLVGPPAEAETLAAPGPDGSLVLVARGLSVDPTILLLDRDGALTARWVARRVGYYADVVTAICTDPAGDIYTLGVSGERGAAVATVCRLSARNLSADPTCVGVNGVTPRDIDDVNFAPPAAGELPFVRVIQGLIAPEAGGVVFTVHEQDAGLAQTTHSRVVRVDF
jgi:hypothetical protein